MNCYLVKDLLPGYVDGLVGEETERDMQDHLGNCPACRSLYEQMKRPMDAAPIQVDKKEINFLKKIKAKTIRSIAIGFAAITIIFGSLTWIFAIGTPVSSDDATVATRIDKVNFTAEGVAAVSIDGANLDVTVAAKDGKADAVAEGVATTSIDGADLDGVVLDITVAAGSVKANSAEEDMVTTSIKGAYLDQEWVVRLDLTNGKALNVRREYVYEENEDGGTTATGCILTPYAVQPSFFLFESANYSYGYSYIATESPSSDFTVTIRFKDKDIVYSMTDEGLFERQ